MAVLIGRMAATIAFHSMKSKYPKHNKKQQKASLS